MAAPCLSFRFFDRRVSSQVWDTYALLNHGSPAHLISIVPVWLSFSSPPYSTVLLFEIASMDHSKHLKYVPPTYD